MKRLILFTVVALMFLACTGAETYRPESRLDSTLPDGVSPKPYGRGTCANVEGDTIYQLEEAGVSIQWTDRDLRVQGADSKALSYCEESNQWVEETLQKDAKITEFNYSRKITIASVVGSYVSIRDDSTFFYNFPSPEGNKMSGPPSATSQLYTLNLSGSAKRRVILTDIFDRRQIFRILLEDQEIVDAIKEANGNKLPSDLDALQKLLDEKGGIEIQNHRYTMNSNFLESFSFAELNGDNVSVHLMFPNSQERVFDSLVKTITLPIPEKLMSKFIAASRLKAGYLERDMDRIANGRKTVIEFRSQ